MTDTKPMQGLAAYLRCEAGCIFQGHPSHETLMTWASEVEAALAAPQPEPQPVKQAPQYCGTSHCSCIECVMEPVKQAEVVRPNIPYLLSKWERRSKYALPADAMLINKHIRELREAIEGAKP